MSARKIEIVDRGTGGVVEALLHSACSPSQLVATQALWGPARMKAIEELLASGHPPETIPQHWHWDWNRKSANLDLLAYRCAGIEHGGQMQGLVMMIAARHSATLAPDQGKPLIYIDYIESAPWNLKPLTDAPRFGGIGTLLFEAAVRHSQAEGFHGRVGLHSLSQAEWFYTRNCGMTMSDPDPAKQGLRYFESTRGQAEAFLSKDGRR